MTIDLKGIERFINDVIETTKLDVLTVQKKVVFDIFSGVVLMTPVDTGRARGGWQITVSAPPRPAERPEDQQGSKVLQEGQKVLGRLPPYDVVFITNNAPHIITLDQGGFIPPNPGPSKDPRKGRTGRILVKDGFSTQAPAGMVDATLSRFEI